MTVVDKYAFSPLNDRIQDVQVEVISPDEREILSNYSGPPPEILRSVEPTLRIRAGWEDEIGKGGTLELEDPMNVDWPSSKLRTWYMAMNPSRQWVMKQFGIWLPATPTGEKTEGSRRKTIEFYDKTLVLKDDQLARSFIAKQGESVIDLVTELVTSSGLNSPVIQDSPETIRILTHWPPGTPKLQVIQELLKTINYTPLTMNWTGDLVSQSMTGEDTKDPVLVLSDDPEQGLGYFGSFTDEQDLFNIPNRWVGATRSEGVLPGLLAVVENTDPESPTSYQARGGRWVTRSTMDVEATNMQMLEEILAKQLKEAENSTREIVVKHPVYDLDVRDLVEFYNHEHGISVVGKVINLDLSLNAHDSECTTTLRVVRKI